MSAPTPSPPCTDRNLLFGILAVQMDFVSRDALIRAMNAWVLDKGKHLGQILVEQGALADGRRTLLEDLVQEHLKLHGGDAKHSLAAVSSVGSVRDELEQISDLDLHASLAHVAAARADVDPDATVPPPTAGTPTSSGLRFRILRPHAKGGLGRVSVAHDEELHREVALKEIQDRHADEPEVRSRFVLEAEVTGGLEHPNIVPVYGLGSYADGRPFYAMRLIRGDSLQEALRRFHGADGPGRDPAERALALRGLLRRFVDVCNAVAYAHSRGVLHRDLKPGNVMLGKYGETLVVDWGLAKAVGRPEGEGSEDGPLRPDSRANDSALTQSGAVIGTPAYMSPEQAAGRLYELGSASDVYSLGATLYCLLTGKAPFEGTDVREILRRVQSGEFLPPHRVNVRVPPALAAICLRAMALQPWARYPGPRALAADVERWLADEPVGAYREPLLMRSRRWARRHPGMSAVPAMLLAVVLAAAPFALQDLRQREALRGAEIEELTTRIAAQASRQRQEARRTVEVALAEASRLRGRARWGEARAVLDQAEERLDDIGLADLRARIGQARRDLNLVARLDAIRLERATIVQGKFANKAAADRKYEAAFREAGMAEVGGDAAAAAAWVADSAVRDALLAALDDWAGCAEGRGRRAWLLEVARRAAPGPWPDGARSPAAWDDAAALARLAADERSAGQSAELLAALAARLTDLGGDAVPLLRAAQRRYPGDFWVNFELGNALERGAPAEAVGYYRAALALRPRTAAVHNNLGNALLAGGRLDEAVNEFRQAIDLDPKSASAHCLLGHALNRVGLHATAARLYSHVFAAQPELADDLQAAHRYNAACSAALAGCRRGEAAARLDDEGRARLRQQALRWLRADLSLWAKRAARGKAEDRAVVRQKLLHWEKDSDLAGLRDPAALEKLPEAERQACQKLWAEVDALLKKAAAPTP